MSLKATRKRRSWAVPWASRRLRENRNLGDRTFIKIVRAVNALGIFPKSWSARSSRRRRAR